MSTPARAYTPEEAAAVIGGNCKPYLLKKLAREKKIGCLRIGNAYNFTDEHIDEAIAYFTVRAAQASPARSAAATRKPPAQAGPLPGPAAGVVHIRPRQPRNRRGAA